jgi:hypothetical protein
MSHFIDSELPCFEEATREIGMARCHNRRIPVYLKE